MNRSINVTSTEHDLQENKLRNKKNEIWRIILFIHNKT